MADQNLMQRDPHSSGSGHHYCTLRKTSVRVFPPQVHPNRVRAILDLANKWANGTLLHYHFFDDPGDGETIIEPDGSSRFVPWTTTDAEKEVVRKAFARWKDIGIGLDFNEVDSRDAAEIRIGFMRGDGSWSYIGKDVLQFGPGHRTMNFGWDLIRSESGMDTAMHEIGHSLGLPHEHQNPNAGIVWDEEAVYAALAKPPNKWSREETFTNIISKIDPDRVQGSSWDPDSIMHYAFEAGLINRPEGFRSGLTPAGGLSARDVTWVQSFYPPLSESDYEELKPFQSSQLAIDAGQQKNYRLQLDATRKYEIRTFGTSDVVIALFEDDNGNMKYVTADDDSGDERNAHIKIKLFGDRRYILRIRLHYADKAGETTVMFW